MPHMRDDGPATGQDMPGRGRPGGPLRGYQRGMPGLRQDPGSMPGPPVRRVVGAMSGHRPPRLIPPRGWDWPVYLSDFRRTPEGAPWSLDRDVLLDLLGALREMA